MALLAGQRQRAEEDVLNAILKSDPALLHAAGQAKTFMTPVKALKPSRRLPARPLAQLTPRSSSDPAAATPAPGFLPTAGATHATPVAESSFLQQVAILQGELLMDTVNAAGQSSAGSNGEPPPKARRIVSKRPPDEGLMARYELRQGEIYKEKSGIVWREQQQTRDMWRSYQNKRHKVAGGELYAEWREMGRTGQRQDAASSWQSLSAPERAMWFVLAADHGQPALNVCQRKKTERAKDDQDEENEPEEWRATGLGCDRENYRGHGFLLTLNGEWGMNLDEVREMDLNTTHADEACKALLGIPYYRALFEQWRKHCVAAATKVRAQAVSCSLEHSTHSPKVFQGAPARLRQRQRQQD